jgi:hypothetical protein
MRKQDLYWLAGVLEGAGCFTISKSLVPRIVVAMIDKDIAIRAARLMGCANVRFLKISPKHRKRQYQAYVFGDEAVALMILLSPLMGERRQRQIRNVLSSSGSRQRKFIRKPPRRSWSKQVVWQSQTIQ